MPINTTHPSYDAMVSRWQRCRDVIAGSDAVKAAGPLYLPRPGGQTRDDYQAYVTRAMVYGATQRTIAALVGAVMYRPPHVTAPEWIEAHLADLTLRDESLVTVATHLVTEVLSVGRAGVLIDHGTGTDARPYWVLSRAEDIVHWQTGPVGADPEQLVRVVLREIDSEPTPDDPSRIEHAERYRELVLIEGTYHARVWTREARAVSTGDAWHAGDWITPMRRGRPLDFLPFAFIGSSGISVALDRPPLIDLVDLNLSHYRSSADHEHGLHYVALPTPWVAGASSDGPLRIGPATAWHLSENGKAGMLEFSGAGLGAIRQAMQDKESLMATLGARALEQQPRTNETATAVRMRHAGETATLATIAQSVGAALTRALRCHAWWAEGTGPVRLDVAVRLNEEFFQTRATPQEVQAALLATQAGAMSFETFYRVLEQGGWARPGVTAAQEQHQIAADTAFTHQDPDDDPDDDLDDVA